ncbi:class II aldolase/adducin family protein [Streptomyces sp. NPDC093097]|uniref:class II aldolase/adducin family protein n=1 Tax=Streptomyces sp. NPDC093097 TaxID=3366027 RepID=UPI003830D3E2
MKPVIIGVGAELQRGNLAAAGRALHEQGWMPGAAGSLSARSGDAVLITVDGPDRGALTRDDIVMVEPGEGLPLLGEVDWPPADTALHLALYRLLPACGAVVQAPTPHATTLASTAGTTGTVDQVTVNGRESAHGMGLTAPHPAALPLVTTWPDVPCTAEAVADQLAGCGEDAPPALLIAGLGVLAWGRDLATARERLAYVEELSRLALSAEERAVGAAG